MSADYLYKADGGNYYERNWATGFSLVKMPIMPGGNTNTCCPLTAPE